MSWYDFDYPAHEEPLERDRWLFVELRLTQAVVLMLSLLNIVTGILT